MAILELFGCNKQDSWINSLIKNTQHCPLVRSIGSAQHVI